MGVLTLRRGDTFIANAAFTVAGVAQDMTNWTLEATLLFRACTPVDLETSWVDQANGQALVRLSHGDTPSLEIGDHELRVRAINPAGDRTSCNPVTVRVSD
jgi:hypothetical protein